MKNKPTIPEIFSALSEVEYLKSLIKKRIIKIVLGSSVIRALPAGTKPILTLRLKYLPVDELYTIDSEKSFDVWHKKQVTKIAHCLIKCNETSPRFEENKELFGHAAKVLNLYLSHLVLYSAYFKPDQIKRIKYYLHVPLDRKVFSALRVDTSLTVPRSIKDLKPTIYTQIQDSIRGTASQFGLAAIYFDEFAWAEDDE